MNKTDRLPRTDILSGNPHYVRLQVLFGPNNTFGVPRYQRGFAWKREKVSDFVGDVDALFEARFNGDPSEHFFGNIVTSEQRRDASYHSFKLIDGQQRMVCFNLLVHALTAACRSLKSKAEADAETAIATRIAKRIDELKRNYISFETEVKRDAHTDTQKIHRLELSSKDRVFYYDLVEGGKAHPDRYSHKMLQSAWNLIIDFVKQKTGTDVPLEEQADRLLHLKQVVDADCSFVHISATRPEDAYKLFRVLNARGTPLEPGYLLRAATLEFLDQGRLRDKQERAVELWDDILSEKETRVNEYLKWFFVAKTGKPLRGSLFVRFLEAIFVPYDDSKHLMQSLRELHEAVLIFRRLRAGEWPFEPSNVSEWERARLNILVSDLKHTHCLPLLLAGRRLGERRFSQLVALLEAFYFRYKIVCNQDIKPASDVYHQEAHELYRSSGHVSSGLNTLKNRLRKIVSERADDDIFKSHLRRFHYHSTKRKKYIKYLLWVLEEHWEWVKGGGRRRASRSARTMADMTVEHVYPQAAQSDNKTESMDELVHCLGNLTVLTQTEQKRAGNRNFEEKREVLANSVYRLSRDLAQKKSWTEEVVRKREELIIDAASKIFIIR